jgi:uncharacterized protein
MRSTVQRVRKTALFIADVVESGERGQAVDRLVVELAALLHDVLDKKYVSTEVAADPYGFFLPYFTRWSKLHGVDLISDGRARTIARIVDSVSWTTEKRLRAAGEWSSWHETTLELHCVQDADRLDAIGAFGELHIYTMRRMVILSMRQASCAALRTLLQLTGQLKLHYPLRSRTDLSQALYMLHRMT